MGTTMRPMECCCYALQSVHHDAQPMILAAPMQMAEDRVLGSSLTGWAAFRDVGTNTR
jgi:hypothetical protein